MAKLFLPALEARRPPGQGLILRGELPQSPVTVTNDTTLAHRCSGTCSEYSQLLHMQVQILRA